jgi:hypothetical protein
MPHAFDFAAVGLLLRVASQPPLSPAGTILIFSSAEYFLRVARRLSRKCYSAIPVDPDFWFIVAPAGIATMNQKSSANNSSHFVQ